MDPISSIANINRLIRSRKLKEKTPKARTGNTRDVEKGATELTNADSPSQTIANAINELPRRKQTGTEGIKLLVEGIITWKFGDNALQDPLIQSNVDKVMKSIISDKASKRATEELIKDLLASTKK